MEENKIGEKNIELISVLANDTVKEMMNHQKKQVDMYRKMVLAILIGFIMTACITVGGILYFFSAYAVEVEDTVNEITVEGETAAYNGVIGDNSNVTVGSDK